MKMDKLDIIAPVELNPYTAGCEEIATAIIKQYSDFGIRRFAVFAPAKGWRSMGYPPKEHYKECAEMVVEIKRLVKNYDIEIGWFMALTLKSGASDKFTSPVKADGSEHKFSSCPLDPEFRKEFAENVALFAKTAKPAFIFTEDDFSVEALNGCFCERHLNEFGKRMGKYYSREELAEVFSQKTPESYELLRKWRELKRDSLVSFAAYMRKELDKESPEIPLGYMQAGVADYDGDATEAVAGAMAGENHIPYSRLFGTFYCGADKKLIPEVLYHPLYSKQHIGDNFRFYHESDAYPHSKFYTAGKHMKAMMGTVFSYGFDGSIFFVSSLSLSSAESEEYVYGQMYAQECKRFNEVYRTAKQCVIEGVEIDYDPFWNTADTSFSKIEPLWVRSISRFGIPFTTIESQVAFWDVRQAKYADDNTVMDRLSKGLFLDGDAAKCLCERGYAKYLGVEVGEDAVAETPTAYDLAACERVCEGFKKTGKNENMWCAHMFCPAGNGRWLKMDVINEKCEQVTCAYTFRNEKITPTMTRFENELGGKVVVMSLTLDGNNSQALYNYTRQRIIQDLISWCSDEYVYVEEIPDVSVVANKAKDNDGDFIGMLTVTNLCEDPIEKAQLHLPGKWAEVKEITVLDIYGQWNSVGFEKNNDSVTVYCEFNCCEPVYIKFMR